MPAIAPQTFFSDQLAKRRERCLRLHPRVRLAAFLVDSLDLADLIGAIRKEPAFALTLREGKDFFRPSDDRLGRVL